MAIYDIMLYYPKFLALQLQALSVDAKWEITPKVSSISRLFIGIFYASRAFKVEYTNYNYNNYKWTAKTL